MQKDTSSTSLSNLIGVSVERKRRKEAYKPNDYKALMDCLLEDMEMITNLSNTTFIRAYFIIWRWAAKHELFSTCFGEIPWNFDMLKKVPSREFNAKEFALECTRHIYDGASGLKLKAFIIVLKYIYRNKHDDVQLELLDRSIKLKVIA